MKDKLQFYINGSWVDSESNERIEVINPANEEIIGHVTAGTKGDIDRAVEAAFEAFSSFQYTSKEERIELLNNIISEYENRYATGAAASIGGANELIREFRERLY